MSNIDAIRPEISIRETAIQAYAEKLDGELIRPGDSDYQEARSVWNGMIDRYPAFIARARSVSDVVASVNFARENDLIISVRGGGHNVAGHATNDGGLVIDLSRLNEVQVDVQNRTVRAGGGATIADMDRATQEHKLVVPMGVVSATGIAGLTLGGGYGWMRNKYGLSADNLIAAEMVTADGRVIQASQEQNFDLLWGLRGGGGNFGVVTQFVYRAYPLGPEVMFALAFHDGRHEKMKRAIQFYRDYSASAPDEVSSIGFTGVIPPGVEEFPEDIQGYPFFAIGAMYAGSVEEGERVLRPLRTFDKPLVDFSGVMPYVDAQQVLDEDYPDGMRYYWKSLNLSRLDDEVIDRVVEHSRKQPSPLNTTDLWPIGGAVTRVSSEESAFHHGRQAAFLLNPEANWVNPDEDQANIQWVRDFVADMQEYSDGSRYLNFAGFQEEGEEMMSKTFGSQYRRLAALKSKYDPENLFRLNQNIKPEA